MIEEKNQFEDNFSSFDLKVIKVSSSTGYILLDVSSSILLVYDPMNSMPPSLLHKLLNRSGTSNGPPGSLADPLLSN